jgi:hypothetical protein
MTSAAQIKGQPSAIRLKSGATLIAGYLAIAVGVTGLADFGWWPSSREHAGFIAGLFLFCAVFGITLLPLLLLGRRVVPWLFVPAPHAPDMMDKAQRVVSWATIICLLLPTVIIVASNGTIGTDLYMAGGRWVFLAISIAGFTFYSVWIGRGIWRRWQASRTAAS